jgi:hypothetical protein
MTLGQALEARKVALITGAFEVVAKGSLGTG